MDNSSFPVFILGNERGVGWIYLPARRASPIKLQGLSASHKDFATNGLWRLFFSKNGEFYRIMYLRQEIPTSEIEK
jgi:hypothetical protein